MNMLPVKFKLEDGAVMPKYAKPGDAGLDLVAIYSVINSDYNYIEYDTGVSVEIPEGYVGLLFPNSRVSKKTLILANCVGVIDSGYRGNILFRYKLTDNLDDALSPRLYENGDVIGQLIIMPYPQIAPIEVDKLSETERGTGGFGSTQ
jgi:dUTP pyrophosphatase